MLLHCQMHPRYLLRIAHRSQFSQSRREHRVWLMKMPISTTDRRFSHQAGRSRGPSLSGLSGKDIPSAIPRHMKSTSSRFSFDMIGAAKQEKLLEDRHRQRELEKKTADVPAPQDSRFEDLDDDGFDYDAMMDDDGFEEDIPMVGDDYDDMDGDFNNGLDDHMHDHMDDHTGGNMNNTLNRTLSTFDNNLNNTLNGNMNDDLDEEFDPDNDQKTFLALSFNDQALHRR
ncbi:hypothetical protein NXS19_010370 [Fusarium pseudograminearum]|nr:hypothetical protein NXS19_010370 [Fusarium pseudograminearum]